MVKEMKFKQRLPSRCFLARHAGFEWIVRMPRFQGFYRVALLVAACMLPPYAGSQQELSPSVNVHCSNTILRAYNTSPEDAKLISDEELEALDNELSELCRPVQGWTTKDQLYRALAMTGVLSERLLRSMNSDTQHTEEVAKLYREMKALRSENQRLRDQLKKTGAH
jgi:hypothetical protein